MSVANSIPIRSFRVCFKFERRIHKIDHWRIPLPFGVPLRGLGYGVALFIGVLLAKGLPIIGALLSALPIPVRYLLLPIAGAYFLTQWEIDGRPALATGTAWLRMRLGARRLVAFQRASAPGVVRLGDVTLAVDDRSARLRPSVITGPASIVLRYPFEARARGRTLKVAPQAGPPQWRGKQIRVGRGRRIVVG